MAKRKRRSPQQDRQRPAKTRSASSQADLTKYKKIALAITVIALALIPFAMGKYIEFNTPGPFDSGAYVYSARHIFEGAKFGIDEKPSAHPGTLLVNFIGVAIFGYSETGPVIIQMLLQITAILLMFFAMRKLFGSLAASVGVIIASLFLSAPLIAKFGNVKEQYMIAFMVIAASCFVMRMVGGRAFWAILTGAAAINIYYFKPTGASVIVAIALCLVAKGIFRTRPWRTIRNDAILIIAGALIGIAPLISFYIWQDSIAWFRNTLPCSLLAMSVKLLIFFSVIYFVIRLCKNFQIKSMFHELLHVRRRIWIPGVSLIAVVFISCMVYFHSFIVSGVEIDSKDVKAHQQIIEEQGYMAWYKGLEKDNLKTGGELAYYLKSVPFVKYPLKFVRYPLGILERGYDTVSDVVSRALDDSGYTGASRQQLGFKEQSKKVFRFYLLLILPISIALASVIAAAARGVLRTAGKLKAAAAPDQIVILFIVWWLLDMTFLWISPRSYEQYYLPLTASAAMLSGYICFLYARSLAASANKTPWRVAGAVAVVAMSIMTVHIFAGVSKSPHLGTPYIRKGIPYKTFGFKQSLDRVADRKESEIGPWEKAAAYIKDRTEADDPIYVWGWYPGIYVQAQRFSSAKKAYESEMNVKKPSTLKKEIARLLRAFRENPPKFIVDSRKKHFPWHYPPLELWPSTTQGFLPNEQAIIDRYDNDYSELLAEKIGPEQAERYKALSPLRKFVMDNYQIVRENFGQHAVFQRRK